MGCANSGALPADRMDKYSSYTDNPDNDCDQDASWNDSIRHKQDHEDHSVVYDNHRDGHLLYLVDSDQVYDFYDTDYGNLLYW
jgi:hypothetical protein